VVQVKNGQVKDSIVADSLEAIFGAISLDANLNAASSVILSLYKKVLLNNTKLEQIDLRDPKGELQELIQAYGLDLPQYSVVDVSGPKHSPSYTVESTVKVYLGSKRKLETLVSVGINNSIKSAEQLAAKDLLNRVYNLELSKID